MARSTSTGKVSVPDGMQQFEAIRTTIKDSLGRYCAPGDMAVLDEPLARRYHEMNLIRVALPDFDFDVSSTEEGGENGTDDEPDASAETAADTSQGTGKRRSRASTNTQ